MNKFMKKLAKKNDGFTLVELIVVIAILGILSAVAVPAYTGYVSEAKKSSDLQVLSSVATAISGVAAAKGQTVTSIEVNKAADGSVTISTTTNPTTPAIDMTQVKTLSGYDEAALKDVFKADWTKATMSGGEWKFQ